MSYSSEVHHYIYNDTTGEAWLVRPDRDDRGLIEMRAISESGEWGIPVRFPREVGGLIREAIHAVSMDLYGQEKEGA